MFCSLSLLFSDVVVAFLSSLFCLYRGLVNVIDDKSMHSITDHGNLMAYRLTIDYSSIINNNQWLINWLTIDYSLISLMLSIYYIWAYIVPKMERQPRSWEKTLRTRWLGKQKAAHLVESSVIIREFTKPSQRLRGHRRLKNEFIIYFIYECRDTLSHVLFLSLSRRYPEHSDDFEIKI